MKPFCNTLLAVSASLTLLTFSCKKTENIAKPVVNANEEALTKQIALDMIRALNSGVSNSESIKPTSVAGDKKVNTNADCGKVSTSFTNKSLVIGDTTRTLVGKSIFTLMCNGYFSNDWNVDAYLLADTLKTTDTGNGFKNIYNVTLNYDVRATNPYYSNIDINGVTTTSSYTSKLKDNVVTEYHKIDNVYGFEKVQAINRGPNPQYGAGSITFKTEIFDKTAEGETSNSLSGYMYIWANNTVLSHFLQKGGGYKVYLVDLKTGEVTYRGFSINGSK